MHAPYLKIPLYKQQHAADCLAACAAMVLKHLGISIRYARLLNLLHITPDLGAPASYIRHLTTLNLNITYASGDLDTLSTYLTHQIPCITFVSTIYLPYWTEATRHAVVVVGIDQNRVYLNDPYFESAPQTASHLEFKLAWDEMDALYAVLQHP